MFQNYFKLAYRNLLSNKLVSGINIIGLGIAIACCITVFLFLKNYYTMDNFHVNADRIYMVEYVENSAEKQVFGNSPMPLGPALAENFPQIERSVRVELKGVRTYLGNQVFDELFYFADPGYFEMFTFPLQAGSAAALNDLDGVILSHELAEKYFPGEDPMGKAITVGFDGSQKKGFTVKAVAAPFPENTGFRFDLLAGFNTLAALGTEETSDWAAMTRGTFVQIKPGTRIEDLENNLSQFVALHNAANLEKQIKSFVFDNLKNPDPKAYEVINRPAEASHPMATVVFAGLALLMFALSCFNYINIALGQAVNRLKEIGVRKVVGGRKRQLIMQFMSENLLLCFIALLLGLAFAQMLLVPFFNSIMVMKISLSLTGNLAIWAFLFILLAVTAVASGAYPAMYISSFQTISIFRGKSSFSKKSKLTRVLLCLQFVLAFATVIGGVLFMSMGDVWKKQSWGYQPEGTLVMRLDEAGQFDLLKNEALRNPNIRQIGGASNHVGESVWRSQILVGDQEQDAARFDVGAGYFEAMGLQLSQGRFFDPLRKTEDGNSVIVNEQMLLDNDWADYQDRQIRSEGKTYDIIGVVDNFKLAPTGVMKPAVFYLTGEENLSYLVVRYASGTGDQVESFMKNAWQKLDSGTPFSFFHQALVFDHFFREFNNVSKLFGYIAALALLIACMGLFGLASQNYASRLKESGIRKVLGASPRQIILQANRNFITLLLIAGISATAICFGIFKVAVVQAADFVGNIELGILPYLLANALVFLMAGIAMGWQSYRLANVMPAKTLRSE